MPPGPAALVKPVPCCVPRLQPCCPAKEVISQQRQVTLSFFLFFFFFYFFFLLPLPTLTPLFGLQCSPHPRQFGASSKPVCTTQHISTRRKGKKKKRKRKTKPSELLADGLPSGSGAPRCQQPPRQPCGERLGLPAWDEMAEAGSTEIRAQCGAVPGFAGWLLVSCFLFGTVVFCSFFTTRITSSINV